MDRRNTYFKQLVTHGELNEICDDVEAGDRNRDIDHAQWGVLSGLVVTETGPASTSVDISAGVAYDELGRRINISAGQTEDLVSYIPGVGGQERYVAIYAQYVEVDSDTRVDGNGVSLDYDSVESFDIVVVQGTAGVPSQSPPGIVSNQVLLALVLLTNGMGTVTTSEISSDWSASPVERHDGGTAWTHGRTQDKIVKIGSPSSGTFLFGNGNTINMEGGDIDMDAGGTGTEGNVYRVRKVGCGSPDVSNDLGYTYTDFSAPLGTYVAVEKYQSYDGSCMFPNAQTSAVSPWNVTSGTHNSWFLAVSSSSLLTVWTYSYNVGGAVPGSNLFIPLTGLPNGCRITTVEVDVVVTAAMNSGLLDFYLEGGIVERDHRNMSDITTASPHYHYSSGSYPYEATVTLDVTGAGHILDHSSKSYYVYVFLDFAEAANGAGNIEIHNARVKYEIREASGIY